MAKTSPNTLPTPSESYWDQKSEDLMKKLGVGAIGLSNEAPRQRLAQFGRNSLETRAQVTSLGLFINQFKSPIVLILLFATLISAFVQDWTDSVIILAIVFGSALLTSIQEINANACPSGNRRHCRVVLHFCRTG